jgi:hypothetical protein
MQAWFQSKPCAECSRPVRCWNRRVSSGVPQGWFHLVCWRRRERSQQYSLYLQAIGAEDQDSVATGYRSDMLALALRELRQLTAAAFAVQERMEQIEKNLTSLRNSVGDANESHRERAKVVPQASLRTSTGGIILLSDLT